MAAGAGFFRRALAGEERLGRTLWLGGLATALCVTALTFAAEALRLDGRHALGDLLDVVKLLVYATWFVCIWRSAARAGKVGRTAAQVAVAAGVIAVAFTT